MALVISALTGMLLSFGAVSICYANSAPPPRVVIIVSDAPSDLELFIGQTKASRDDRLTVTYFVLYPYFEKVTEFQLTVVTENDSFELPLERVSYTYNNVYSLDLSSRELTSGPPSSRFIWAPITIVLTLALEGLVFFLFRYRASRSWLIFAMVNILTQIGLFYWLSQNPIFFDGYLILDFVIGEVLVFLIEIIAFVLLLREHGRLRAFSYALISNIFSLFAGGYLLMTLPASF
jgi:hypothetical protein